MFVLFVIFMVEICIQCFVKKNYFFSFYFWVDVIGTLSLLLDVPFVINPILGIQSSASVNRAGVGKQVSRSADSIRFTRFARILRIFRLIRVIRVFKFQPGRSKANASKVGLRLSETIDKRVVVVVLSLIIFLPILEAIILPDDQDSVAASLGMIDSVWDQPTMVSSLMGILRNYQPDTLYLSVMNSTANLAVSSIPGVSSYRTMELDTWSTDHVVLVLSLRASVWSDAVNNMCVLTFVILVFGVGSYLWTRDVHSLVVSPLERMTIIMRKLAGAVCFLSTETDTDNQGEEYETQVMESIINKVASIFQVEPDQNVQKPYRMMTGHKRTEIKGHGRTVSIEVMERPITEEPSMEEVDISDPVLVDVEKHKELGSVESILKSPAVLNHFKMFLMSKLLAENLYFWQEVERFRLVIQTQAMRIFESFIVPDSVNQVNINDRSRRIVEAQLQDPHRGMFDVVQLEVLQLLRTNAYKQFLESRFCQTYLALKKAGRTNGVLRPASEPPGARPGAPVSELHPQGPSAQPMRTAAEKPKRTVAVTVPQPLALPGQLKSRLAATPSLSSISADDKKEQQEGEDSTHDGGEEHSRERLLGDRPWHP